MIRVVVSGFVGICAGFIAPLIGTSLTRFERSPFIRLKGRDRVSREVVTTMVIFAVVFALISVLIENWAVVVATWVLSLGLITASWIDAHTHRLPRKLSYAIFSAGLPLLVVAAIVENDLSRIVSSALGVVLATGLIGFLYWIGRGAMGGGDVRLAPVIGLYTGWISVQTVILAVVTSFFLAAIFALVLLVGGRANRRDDMPLGPFLACGTLAVFIYAAVKSGL